MYKRILAFVLIVAISLQTLNRVVVYIDYYTNYAEYLANCENKALPQMHCNGKCQMMKKLKEQEKKDGEVPVRKSINDEVISSRSFFASVDLYSRDLDPVYRAYIRLEPVQMPRAVFHPPGV